MNGSIGTMLAGSDDCMGEVRESGEKEKLVRASFCGERDMSSAGRFEETGSVVEGLIVSDWLVGGSLDAGTWDCWTEVIVRHELMFESCLRQEERVRGGGDINSVDDKENGCSMETKKRHLIEESRGFHNPWNGPRPGEK